MHDEQDVPLAATGTAEDESSEALSRAAREAVRQPADPRLEESFARLGLFNDEEGNAPKRARVGRAGPTVVDAPPAPDLEPLRREIAGWRTTAEDLSRRLAIITWILLALTVTIGLLAVVLIVRG